MRWMIPQRGVGENPEPGGGSPFLVRRPGDALREPRLTPTVISKRPKLFLVESIVRILRRPPSRALREGQTVARPVQTSEVGSSVERRVRRPRRGMLTLLEGICDAWNAAAYHGDVKDSPNWPLPEGVERIELRRGEVWFRYEDGREEFVRTM